MGDLRREGCGPCDPVGVFQELSALSIARPEPRPPGHETLVDLRRDVHLRHLVEHVRSHGQQPSTSVVQRGRPGITLEAALEGEGPPGRRPRDW